MIQKLALTRPLSFFGKQTSKYIFCRLLRAQIGKLAMAVDRVPNVGVTGRFETEAAILRHAAIVAQDTRLCAADGSSLDSLDAPSNRRCSLHNHAGIPEFTK